MFTIESIPPFVAEEASKRRLRYNVMHPDLLRNEPVFNFFRDDPRLNPRAYVVQWISGANRYGPETNNYFLEYPPYFGYAVSMWFHDFDVGAYNNDWRWIWYWRAIVWHDMQDIVSGHWWPAQTSDAVGGTHYYLIFRDKEEAAKAARYMEQLSTTTGMVGR